MDCRTGPVWTVHARRDVRSRILLAVVGASPVQRWSRLFRGPVAVPWRAYHVYLLVVDFVAASGSGAFLSRHVQRRKHPAKGGRARGIRSVLTVSGSASTLSGRCLSGTTESAGEIALACTEGPEIVPASGSSRAGALGAGPGQPNQASLRGRAVPGGRGRPAAIRGRTRQVSGRVRALRPCTWCKA